MNSLVNRKSSLPLSEIQDHWVSCNIFYHENLDRILSGLVCPVVVSLVQAGQVDAFFFVRYSLGGPHIRLRLKANSGLRARVLKEVERAAEDFLSECPSTKSWKEDAIRKGNELILSSDQYEADASVYPDNSLWIVPFYPEIERYGGPDLYRVSLDFFMLSSVQALQFLIDYGDSSRSVRLIEAFRLLVRQALGFARNEAELADLLRYGVDAWGASLPTVVAKADAVTASQRNVFRRLLHECVTEVKWTSDFLARGAREFVAAIGIADPGVRSRIGTSQLHMTANRLGLSNAEEVYLGRLLTAILREVSGDNISWPGKTQDPHPEIVLGRLASQALKIFAEGSY